MSHTDNSHLPIIPVYIQAKPCHPRCRFCEPCQGMDRRGWFTLTPTELRAGIETHISRGKSGGRLAFFGTGVLDMSDASLRSLLSVIEEYKDAKSIGGLQLSLRPEQAQNKMLPNFVVAGLNNVELWVPSLDPGALRYLGPFHAPESVRAAKRSLEEMGLKVVAHMSPGMPGTQAESALMTAEELVSFGVEKVRITPVVVLKGSNFEEAERRQIFRPLDLKQAVSIGKVLLDFFEGQSVPVLRYGWQPSDLRVDANDIQEGAYHPALRTQVEAARMFDLANKLLQLRVRPGQEPQIWVHPSESNYLRGLQSANILRLRHRFRCRNLQVVESTQVPKGSLTLKLPERSFSISRGEKVFPIMA